MAEDPNKPQRLRELEEAQAALNKRTSDYREQLADLKDLEVAQGELTEAQIANRKKLQQAIVEENKSRKALSEELEEQNKLYQEQQKALEAIEARYAAVEKSATMFQGALNNIAGAFQQVTGLKIPMTVGDMATEFLGLATQVDTASTSLRKATGYTSKLDGDLIAARKNTYRYGESWEGTAERVATANNQITLFAAQSPKVRGAMVDMMGDLKGVGISVENSAKSMDILSRGMGFTAMGAVKATKELDTLAQSIGMVPNDLLQTFTNLGPELAKFGKRSTVEFRKLARQAKSLGLSVQDVFDVGKQFDTFEGAAEIAGQLNAQLGLRLNSVELLNATEGDRLKILREELAMRGKNFDAMGRFEKQAIAQMLNVDVDRASRMFGSAEDLAKYKTEMKTIAERQEMMTSIADRFQGVMNKLWDELAKEDGPVARFNAFLKEILDDFSPDTVTKWGDTLKNVLIGVAGVMGASLGAALTITIGSVRTITTEIKNLAAAMTAASVINPVGGIDMPDSDGESGGTLGDLDIDAFFSRSDSETKSSKGASPKGSTKSKGFKGKMKGIAGSLKGLMKGGLGKGIFSILKKVPIMGLVAGIGGTASRLMQGDYTGALMQLAAGAASTVPGIGTALSMGIEAADLARGSMESDFVMQNGKVTSFRKDDLIMGGTSLMNQGGGMSRKETKELATAIGQEVSKAVTGALKGAESKTVKLMLNDRELGSVVTNIVEERLSLTTA